MKHKITIPSCLLAALLSLQTPCIAGYVDHRGHNVDSLEAVVVPWTEARIAQATDEELNHLARDWEELMLGCLQLNGERSHYYGQKLLKMSLEKGWNDMVWSSAKVIGQHFWAKECYDSAAFYYNLCLEAIGKMEIGAVEPDHPGGITQSDIDDSRSILYGTLGNLYSIQDSTALAMEYYNKAGEIFKKHGWNNSLACLYYNIGETWRDKGNLRKAADAFTEGLAYAKAAGDSLWMAGNRAGYGTVQLQRGHLRKAIKLLDEANQYYSAHDDQEWAALLQNLGYTNQVLRLQKRQAKAGLIATILALILLAVSTVCYLYLKKLRHQKSQTEDILQETIEEITTVDKDGVIRLTDREKQILDLIAAGQTNKQIAETVFLSPDTIKWYRKKLLVKFEATNSAELIAKSSGIRS